MQIPSESFEAVGYCLLSVKSINNKYSICEIDVSGMSDTMSDTMPDTISDGSSNAISKSDNTYMVNAFELDVSISNIDFNIDISDIDISDIDKLYNEYTQLPDVIVKIHKEKNINEHMNFHEFFYILTTIIESFIFEEAYYLFDIFG